MKYLIEIETVEPTPELIAWLRRKIREHLFVKTIVIRTEESEVSDD